MGIFTVALKLRIARLLFQVSTDRNPLAASFARAGKSGICSCGITSSLITSFSPCIGWKGVESPLPGWEGIFESSNQVGRTDLTP